MSIYVSNVDIDFSGVTFIPHQLSFPMRFLITGTAGFIGFHLAYRLLKDGHTVIGIDGMSPYYDVSLKRARHTLLRQMKNFICHEFFLEDTNTLNTVFKDAKPDVVIHLAAQAGVRYSIKNSRDYLDSNLVGTFNVMEAVRISQASHFMFASSSSVYSGNAQIPSSEKDNTPHPLTFYAATKKAGEVMTHSYSHLWKIPTTCLRFFTAYGPWGRPDMALFKFVKNAISREPIDIYGNGEMQRDFTYIDDLIEAVIHLIDKTPVQNKPVCEYDSLSPVAPFRVVNIGASKPISLLEFINEIESALNIPIHRNMTEMLQGDVIKTFANTDLLLALTGYHPNTPLNKGIHRFIEWYKERYV